MRNIVWMIAVMVGLAASARAEDAWVQVAARPTLAQAQDQAREFSRTFTNVQGFRLPSGWYGIVLGPYSSDQAQAQLGLLLGEGMIPRDSFVAQGGGFGAPFWPDTAAAAAPPPEVETDAAPAEAADPADSAEAALAFEAAMTAADRQEVQDALRFAGIYDGKSDGAFGKATRAALAAWQAGQALAPTGLLAPDQRDRLVQPWRQETALVGLSRVAEAEAGITIDLPMGLVEFDRYDPPFVRYRPRGGSGYEILLISMRGGQEALAPLHDRLLGLGLVPPGGQDTVGTGFLSLSGADGARVARAEATRKGSFIKGFLIAGPAGQDQRLKRILQAMEDSFTAQPDAVLDAGAGVASTVSQADLTAGLDVRHPALSHSGVYVDAGGSVLTAAEGLDSCTRLTLDGQHEARLVWQDRDAGIALLAPEGALAPHAVAGLAGGLPAADAVVAIGGYPYGDRLSAPVVSFGTFAEGRGLQGEADRARLTLRTEPGDAGAAVLGSDGAMIGILLPRGPRASQDLPRDVAFAIPAAALAERLAASGHGLAPAAPSGALAPEDLAARARAMTALVSCWK